VGVNGSKKRKLVKSAIGKFKPPAQSLPSRPVKGPVTKPTVAFMSTYMKPNSSTTVNPTAQVNTNVHTNAPTSKTVVKPTTIVHTNVKTAPNTHIVINPSATVNTTVNITLTFQTFVKPYTIVKTIIQPVLKQRPPNPAKPSSNKLDLSKVRRSGRTVWKKNANFKGPRKAIDDPIEAEEDDKDAETQPATKISGDATKVAGDAKDGFCLGLLKKIDTTKYV